MLQAILATARHGVVGDKGGLPWPRIAEDMRRFRALTMGHACIVGARTFATLPALPGRFLVVVSRTMAPAKGQVLARSIEAALAMARALDAEPFVIGGAEIYRLAMPCVERVYLTEIDREVAGDTRFDFDRTGFRETAREQVCADVAFVTLER